MKGLLFLAALVIIGFIVVRLVFYIVDETEQVIILRFNEVIATRTNPGLGVKAPFVDQVVRFEKRIL